MDRNNINKRDPIEVVVTAIHRLAADMRGRDIRISEVLFALAAGIEDEDYDITTTKTTGLVGDPQ